MMDWLSVARLLAERCELPVAVLDRGGAIRLSSATLERTLGLRASELEGRRWIDACAAPESAAATATALEQGFAGAIHAASCEAVTKDGRRLRLSLDLSLVGRPSNGAGAPGGTDGSADGGASSSLNGSASGSRGGGASGAGEGPLGQGLLVTVLASAPVQGAWTRGQDLDYTIAFSATEFGTIKHAATAAGCELAEARGRHCYEFVAGLDKPCPDCPALRPAANGHGQRLSVRGKTNPDGFEVTTADATRPDEISLRIRGISSSTLTAIQDARIAALSTKAQLTERERDILALLLHGRSHDEIAQSLTVSPRTVKFHQGNILQKLGADSRADLLRLAGF
jgi:PAS domain S-box-containing protein